MDLEIIFSLCNITCHCNEYDVFFAQKCVEGKRTGSDHEYKQQTVE